MHHLVIVKEHPAEHVLILVVSPQNHYYMHLKHMIRLKIMKPWVYHFLMFHLISFSNDLWQLDPSRHYLIAMFPQNFFFDATVAIAIATIFEALLLTLLSSYSVRLWLGKRFALIQHSVKTLLSSKNL